MIKFKKDPPAPQRSQQVNKTKKAHFRFSTMKKYNNKITNLTINTWLRDINKTTYIAKAVD